jgi:hypothetical protein
MKARALREEQVEAERICWRRKRRWTKMARCCRTKSAWPSMR